LPSPFLGIETYGMVRPVVANERPAEGTGMTDTNRDHIQRVLEIINETERDGLLSDHREDGLSGISSLRTVGVLPRLAKLCAEEADACYLEIGVFQGLTLVSTALEAPEMPCFGIDNFATLDPDGVNKGIATERLEAFGVANAALIDADFEDALGGLDAHLEGRKACVYFIDGPHDYRSQMVCLLAGLKHLREGAVIIIDDANYPDVRWSTRDFLTGHPAFKLIFEAYSPAHPVNMTATEKDTHEQGWLNGVNILVHDPDGHLPDMLPPVEPAERLLYFNEWLAHRKVLAELAPEALDLAWAVCSGDAVTEAKARDAILEKYKYLEDKMHGRFSDRNVYSTGLTAARFNKV